MIDLISLLLFNEHTKSLYETQFSLTLSSTSYMYIQTFREIYANQLLGATNQNQHAIQNVFYVYICFVFVCFSNIRYH